MVGVVLIAMFVPLARACWHDVARWTTNSTQASAQPQTNQGIQLTNPLSGTTPVSDEPKTPGFTISAEMMPKGDVYFVTIIKGHNENDGIWVLDRPLTKATEKAGFALIMEAAKQGDAKHYPLPDKPKSGKEE